MAEAPGVALAGNPDRVEDATLTGGDWVGTLPVTNLATERMDEVTRSSTLDPVDSLVNIVYDEDHYIRTVHLINHNLSSTSQVRYVAAGPQGVDNLKVDVVIEPVTPTAIEASSNLTGAITDIDEDPHSPDANWLTQTNPTTYTTDLRVSFGPPPSSLSTGADLQLFRFWVRGSNSNGRVADITVELWEAGALVSTLTPRHQKLKGNNAIMVFAPWDLSDLANSTGADVEARISCTQLLGGVEIGAVDWLCEHGGLADGQIDYDSGYIEAYPAESLVSQSGVSISEIDLKVSKNATIIVPATSASNHAKAKFLIRDGANLDGYISASRLIGGSAWVPSLPLQRPLSIEVEPTGDLPQRTDSGYHVARSSRLIRRLEGTISFLPEDEAIINGLFLHNMRLGVSKPFVIVPRLDNGNDLIQVMAFQAVNSGSSRLTYESGQFVRFHLNCEEV